MPTGRLHDSGPGPPAGDGGQDLAVAPDRPPKRRRLPGDPADRVFGDDIRDPDDDPYGSAPEEGPVEAVFRGEVTRSYAAEVLGISPMEVQDILYELEAATVERT